MNRYLLPLVVLVTFAAGCSHNSAGLHRKWGSCALAGAATGALIVGGAGTGLAVGLDCGPGCVERKIKSGEPPHQAYQHHLNRRDDELLYGVLPGVAIAAAVGAVIGHYYCDPLDLDDAPRRAAQPPPMMTADERP